MASVEEAKSAAGNNVSAALPALTLGSLQKLDDAGTTCTDSWYQNFKLRPYIGIGPSYQYFRLMHFRPIQRQFHAYIL
jgi:outer membrane protein W